MSVVELHRQAQLDRALGEIEQHGVGIARVLLERCVIDQRIAPPGSDDLGIRLPCRGIEFLELAPERRRRAYDHAPAVDILALEGEVERVGQPKLDVAHEVGVARTKARDVAASHSSGRLAGRRIAGCSA